MMKRLPAEFLCAGVAILVYVNTFHADFVYDDSRAILSNLDVRTSTPLCNTFFNDFWGTPMTHSGSHKSYRPLTTITFRLNYAISGFRPWSYHAVNVVLHALVTYLFVILLKKRIFRVEETSKSLAAGLLFAVHPVHTEAVAGVVGRADILAALFVLACLLSYSSHCDRCESLSSDVSKGRSNYIPHITNRTSGNEKGARQRKKSKKSKQNNRERHSKLEIIYPNGEGTHGTTKSGSYSKQENNSLDADISNFSTSSRILEIASQLLPYVFAFFAIFSKETGFCSLPLCAVYDIWVRNNLGCSLAIKILFFKENTSKRLQLLRRRIWTLVTATLILLSLRMLPWKFLSSNSIAPSFSASDNPVSFSDSLLTRTLTFNYLVSFNAILLMFPLTLSYDWGEIPLVESLWDHRNLYTFLFYTVLFLTTKRLWKQLRIADFHYHKKFCVETYASKRQTANGTCNPAAENAKKLQSSFLLNRRQHKLVPPNMLLNALSRKASCHDPPLLDEGIHMDGPNMPVTEDSAKRYRTEDQESEDLLAPMCEVDYSLFADCSLSREIPESTNSSGYATEGSEEGHDESVRDCKRHSAKSVITCMDMDDIENSNFSDAEGSLFNKTDIIFRDTTITLMGIAIMIIPFLPVTNLLFYVGFVVAERLLYLPSAGFCILVTHGWSIAREKVNCTFTSKRQRQRNSKIIVIAGITLLILLAIRTLSRTEDWKNELNLYRSGITTSPAKSWSNLGNVMKDYGRIKEAETCYVNALKQRGNMADVHYNLGLLYQEQKRYDEALARYQMAIHFRKTLAVAYLNSGIVLSELGRAENAEKMYRHAVLIDDTGLKNPRAHAKAKISALYNLGCLLASNRKHEKAIEAFEDAVKRLTPDYEPQSLYNMLGQSLFKLKRMDEAERWFKAALKAKDSHIPAHLTYALLLRETERPLLAEKIYLKALDIEPHNHVIYNHFAKFYGDQKRYEDAIQLLEKAINTKFGASDYETLMSAGDAYRRLKDYTKAEKHYKRATKISPESEAAFVNLGATLHLQGKYREAMKSYEAALNLRPGEPIATQNLLKLKNYWKSDSKKDA